MHQTEELGPTLGRCAHLARERMVARLSQHDATPAQAHVLLYLYQHGGQAPQWKVTEFLKVKPSTANGILNRMEEKALVIRTVSGADARCRLITLTDKGREQQELFFRTVQETEALMAKGFGTEELSLLRAFLKRVIENLEEDRTA